MAAVLVAVIGIRETIMLAIVPGALAAIAITIAARQARRTLTPVEGRRTLSLNLSDLRQAGLARALTPAALFELGNLATTLLILRATNLLTADGRSVTAATSIAILLYAAHNGAATFASLGGGHLADRFSPRGVFTGGAAVYVLGYLVFAWEQHRWPILLIGFALCGLGIGFAETAESTVVAQLLPEHLRSNGFGVLGLVQSFGDLGATMITGILWSVFSATVAFLYAATWMILSVAASGWLRPPSQRPRQAVS